MQNKNKSSKFEKNNTINYKCISCLDNGKIEKKQFKKGKCGICGDEITSKIFEKGGKYYRDFNVKSYKKIDKIEAVVEVSEK